MRRPRWREWDWDLFLVVAVFALVPMGRVLLATPLAWAANVLRHDAFEAYEQALARAAIKAPVDDKVQLATLDAAAAAHMAVFRYPSLTVGKLTLEKEMWVALPDDLKKLCSGSMNPQLRLQQALGLPPRNGRRSVYELTVKPGDMFRPCVGGPDTTTKTCSFTYPETPVAAPYDTLAFVSRHMWETYRTGFDDTNVGPGDYPYGGYPFTGMGWTYDWSPLSKTHVGVTEFVIRPKSDITVDREVQIKDFCAAAKK